MYIDRLSVSQDYSCSSCFRTVLHAWFDVLVDESIVEEYSPQRDGDIANSKWVPSSLHFTAGATRCQSVWLEWT